MCTHLQLWFAVAKHIQVQVAWNNLSGVAQQFATQLGAGARPTKNLKIKIIFLLFPLEKLK